jgi:hypothetical protein
MFFCICLLCSIFLVYLLCFSSAVCFQGTIQVLDGNEMLSAAELAQWEDSKLVNDMAASQGTRIHIRWRFCPTISMKEIEEEM